MKKNNIALKAAACVSVLLLHAGTALPAGMNAFPAFSFTVSAEEETGTPGENDLFYYAKFSDHVTITSCKSTDGDTLAIPAQIDGLPVTEIGIYACQYHKMKSLTLPDSLTEIGHYAFSYCENLTAVTLPDSLKKMGLRTFEKCASLAEVTFPDHLVETGEFSFDNTPWLDAQRKKDPLVIVNGAVIDGRTCEGKVVVPSDVKYVAGSAFSGNSKITEVVFPTGVHEIKESTFRNCENLTSAELKGCTSLGYGVFEGCGKLTDLKLSGKLTYIDYYTFIDNNATATITFYGSQATWNSVEKPDNDPFLNRASYIFDENHTDIEEVEGDINMDGVCNLTDAVLLAKWLSAEPDTELKNWQAGDFNKDGKLTGIDLSLLKRALLSGS